MTTGEWTTGTTRAWRAAWVLLAITTAVRAVVAAAFPLLPDETYFWEWSRHLAAGYYDHPPGIAWTIAAGTAMLGDTTFGVRAAALVCGAVAAGGLMIAARDVDGEGAALRASLLFAVLPLSSGLILAVPDAPLAACVSIGLLATLRATAQTRNATWWWIAAGTASGLAMATKLTGVLLPLGTATACMLIPEYRRTFRTPGPYLAVGLATLILLPVLAWNANNDWIAFRFQLDHGLGDRPVGGAGTTLQVLLFIGGQLLVSGVLLGALMGSAVYSAARDRDGVRARFLATLSLVAFAPFAISALRTTVEPNWTAVAYPALIVLLATSGAHRRAPRTFRNGVVLAVIMVVFAYLSALRVLSPEIVPAGPLVRAYGWRPLAEAVATRTPTTGSGRVFLSADRYQDASQIAFHAEGRPFALALNIDGRQNQYDLWPGFRALAARGDHLVVALPVLESESGTAVAPFEHARPTVVERLAPHFAHARLDTLVTGVGGARAGTRGVWVLEDWRGTWPPDR